MKTVTVTQVNEYIAKKLKDDFALRDIAVEGEISGLSMSGRNMYLTLKDAGSQIRCNIWSSYLQTIDRSMLENGKKIIALCDISPYAKGGYYSLSIKRIKPAGEGDLMAEFNRIKQKLEAEGLFAKEHKRPIPVFPRRIGVITSATGAAIEDIKKIITSKNDYTDVIIFPTFVQGAQAPASIIANIELANRVSREEMLIDTLIVGRGGGSPEDLAPFNDEGVARAIYASEIPVISAVGHESDFSISDFVADLRAETPTAAADKAVMDTFELREEIMYDTEVLIESMRTKLGSAESMLSSLRTMILSSISNRLREASLEVEKSVITLRENDPRRILGKGYALVTDGAGKIVSNIGSVEPGERYDILLADGKFRALAESAERNNSYERK